MATDLETMKKDETLRLRKELIGPSCTLFHEDAPIKMVRGCGVYLYDEKNNQYLDCINNVASVGHSNPHVTQACVNQMSLLNTNCRFLHDNIVVYAQRLTSYFPKKLCVCYFVNSGSEANDLALRLSRAHTSGTDVITLEGAYHGHLQSTTDISPVKFENIPNGKKDYVHVAHMPCSYRGQFTSDCFDSEELGKLYANDVRDIIARTQQNGRKVSAFIAESMISCGGQVLFPSSYLENVYKIVRDAGGVVIADEVQTGFARTGHFWAFETQNVCPDIVTFGKPMGCGFPVAGVVTTKEIAESFKGLGVSYFNTYGGNPTAMAVANAVLDVIENEDLMFKAKILGNYIKKAFEDLKEKHALIGDIRGIGLFWGIELVSDRITKHPATEEAALVVQKLKEKRILLTNEGIYSNVLKFKPPLVFNKDNVNQLVSTLDEVLSSMNVKRSGSSGYESGSESFYLSEEDETSTSSTTGIKKTLTDSCTEVIDKCEI